jgi:hypothetical protein
MNGYIVGLVTFLVGLVTAALGELLSEEIRDRLDRIPHGVLRLASRFVDPAERASMYDDEWVPELTYILKGTEARPITRLVNGTSYALGILFSARRIARHLHRSAQEQGVPELGGPQELRKAVPVSLSGAGNFLISLSGARPDVLERCPSERVRFQSLGWALLITCAMAGVSMWFALSSAMGINSFAALPIAALWLAVILGIDRWLVTSMPLDGSRKFAMAIPRLVLALLLGTLISTPMVLRIFQSEINNQISVIREHQAASFLSAQEHSTVEQQVTTWNNTVNSLENVINSHGAVTVVPSSDPIIKSLNADRASEENLQKSYYQQWQCQLYGGPTCDVPKGDGPLAQATHTEYEQAAQQVNRLDSEIQTREQQLSASNAASQQTRYQDAISELPSAKQQLQIATGRQEALLNSFDASNDTENGLLIRLQALNQLTEGNSTVNYARLLLFLMFLVIECLPVTVRLLQRPGNYEKILRHMIRQELRDARRGL